MGRYRSAGRIVDKRKNHRTGHGDHQCECKAYKHPHRQFGGKCRPLRWVERFFDPSTKDCRDCHCLDRAECHVVLQVETVWHCPALREHVTFQGIKLYGKAKREHDKMVRSAHL